MNLLLTTPALNVFEQMALDDVLVRMRPGEVTLRFYNWVPGPALTFGCSQFIREIRNQLAARSFSGEYCRRPTGGGLVYHQDDLTFSLIFPSQDSPSLIYKNLHRAISAALTHSGLAIHIFDKKLPASSYAPSRQHIANACFTNPVENDLLLENGQKMLGGAIRRFGTTVLYQGSLQLPDARENTSCKQAVIGGVRSFLAADFCIRSVSQELLAQARTLAQTQYQSTQWQEKF